MRKWFIAFTIAGVMTAPAAAQSTSTTTSTSAAASGKTKPPTEKKRVCEQLDEDPYSRLGNRKICRTIEVPAEQPKNSNKSTQAPATTPTAR